MLKMWEQANLYARFVMCMYFIIPTFFVVLTCLAEKGDKPEKN